MENKKEHIETWGPISNKRMLGQDKSARHLPTTARPREGTETAAAAFLFVCSCVSWDDVQEGQ